MTLRILIVLIIISGCTKTTSHNQIKEADGLAMQILQNPPMGWNSWNCFGIEVNEDQVKANVDYMANHLKDSGWEYILIDLGWFYPPEMKTRDGHRINPPHRIDKFGRLLPDLDKFPSASGEKGFAPLSAYIHKKGLKIGITMLRGIPWDAIDQNTSIMGTSYFAKDILKVDDECEWNHSMKGINGDHQGAEKYYQSLIKLYSEWGIDYIKMDDVSRDYHGVDIELVSKAISEIDPSIVLSLAPGPLPLENVSHASKFAQSWRITNDFWDSWNLMPEQFKEAKVWHSYAKPGNWPDLGMLPIGKLRKDGSDEWVAMLLNEEYPLIANEYSRLNDDEVKTMMVLWCIFKSPLMIGGNLPENDSTTLSILKNKELIEVNQHSINSKPILYNDSVAIWIADKPDSKSKYLAVFNLQNQMNYPITIRFEELKMGKRNKIRDIWDKKELGEFEERFNYLTPPHGAGIFIIDPI